MASLKPKPRKRAGPNRVAAPDFLANAASVAGISPAGLKAVRQWLAEQLVAYEYAKLGQGGHTSTQIPLRQVFVDLPVTSGSSAFARHGERVLFLNKLLSAPAINLHEAFYPHTEAIAPSHAEGDDGQSEEDEFQADFAFHELEPRWGATLLIGGPGQGKSTLGQLACQLHRAALVKPAEKELTSGQRDLVNSFVPPDALEVVASSEHRLGFPSTPLLPLQIALPDFAAWLSRNSAELAQDKSTPALLTFLADLPSAKSFGLTGPDLFAFASHMPSLLVLDGFDEVGATSDRERIVAAGRALFRALAEKEGTAQVVATTRPQGYADELAHIGIKLEKRYLAPLELAEALEYAQKLVEAKIPGVDQRQKALTQIHEAAAEPATERLLTTPLQVTILTALVQQLGRAPRERWNLFSRYFAYTYDREIERNTYASGLLAEHRAHIERIHARVALLLQVEAEKDGGASARMTRERLEEVIAAVLAEDEVSPIDHADLVREIASAAENRLVFLVEPEPGKFGFEIRSLQEFMAAWALTGGRDSEIEARLLQVAKAPMFRNVALFVASRLFSEGSPLRDVLADRICGSLNEDAADEATRVTRAGSLLALETLEEGAVLSQPKRARALMVRASNLLELPAAVEHVRLARIANAETSSVLREAIWLGLDAVGDRKINAVAAWACIFDAINRSQSWAIELGELLWPPKVKPAILFESLARVGVPVSPWLANKLQESLTPVSPGSFIGSVVLEAASTSESWPLWLISLYGADGVWSRRRATGRRIPALVVPLAAATDAALSAPDVIPSDPQWLAWILAAQFETSPSAEALARALDGVAKAIPVAQWRRLQWRSSWPLASCLAYASTSEEAERLVIRLRAGEFGDISDWRSAERKWGGNFDYENLLSDLSYEAPWTVSSIQRSPPLFAMPSWGFVDRELTRSKRSSISTLLSKADVLFRASELPTVRQRLAEVCLYLWRRPSTKAARSNYDVLSWVNASPASASVLVPRPKFLPLSEWVSLLDACSSEPSHPWLPKLRDYFDALIAQPSHPVLLRLTVLVIEHHRDQLSLKRELKPPYIGRVSEALRGQAGTTVSSRADIATLLLFLGTVPTTQDDELLGDLAAASKLDPRVWSRALSALSSSRLPRDRVLPKLVKIFAEMGSDHAEAHVAIRQLRDGLQKQTSDLDSYATWNRLALPLPFPRQPLHARLNGRIPEVPVNIDSIDVRDIGGIRNLKFEFKTAANGHGQWIVFLGPNGVGKTTLLRSLALALRSVKHPGIWPKGAFSNSWQRVAHSSESKVSESSIEIRLGDGIGHRTLIRPTGSISITQLPEQDQPRLFPLFAYGCRRGSALGGASRQVNLSDDDGPEIATLFDDGADLIQAETWLVALEGDTTKNPRSKVIFECVVEALKVLLDVESIRVADQKLWVAERGQPLLPFNALSDGYLTNAGWFLDLVARWVKLAETSELNIHADFLGSMRGLVLIDEIDLHLHPRWQIEIISRTRRLLPQMSFVVTTHNPLTLVGARPDEIWILSRESGEVLASTGVEVPMLLTGGQLYRRYFGIQDIYPDGLGRALQRYGFLSGYAMRNNDEQSELESLQKHLRGAGIDPGWDVVNRAQIS